MKLVGPAGEQAEPDQSSDPLPTEHSVAGHNWDRLQLVSGLQTQNPPTKQTRPSHKVKEKSVLCVYDDITKVMV